MKYPSDIDIRRAIIELYLQCIDPIDISNNVGISTRQIERIIKERQERIYAEMSPPDSYRPYNLWSFNPPNPDYGLDYPGRIPGQIIENLLYYYTEPFDKVIDPMAGGGTEVRGNYIRTSPEKNALW